MNTNQPITGAEKTGGSSAYVITAIIAFAIGFGSAWLVYNKDTKSSTTTKTTATTTTTSTSGDVNVTVTGTTNTTVNPSMSDAKISVNGQASGATVAIQSVTLSAPAWVVIRESDETGKPGRILGAQLFDLGTNSGTVELLRGTLQGKIYFAIINADNGDHAFDPKLDLPLNGTDGNTVMATFKTTE